MPAVAPAKTKQKKKWVRFRHRIVRNLAALIIGPWSYLKYRIKITPLKGSQKRQYLILMNHQTAFDQFFVGMAFKQPVYYIASEDLFNLGFLSKLLRWAVAPIPIKKQTTDVQAVMNCMRVAKEGGTICLAPEGNRTYGGKPVHINPAITPLVKKLGLPLAIFRIEGGFGVQPRWSDVCRKGGMRGYVSRVIEPEEYKELTKEELYALICKELAVDETQIQGEYPHPKAAEYLERAMYVCPQCGLSEFESHGVNFRCKTCGLSATYMPDKTLKGKDKEFPFRYLADWYDYQCNYVNQLDVVNLPNEPIYQDTVQLSLVQAYTRKEVLQKAAPMAIYPDRLTVGDMTMPLQDINVITVLGKNKLNIYFDKNIYQIQGDARFNGLKYMNLFFRVRNQQAGDGKTFLGI